MELEARIASIHQETPSVKSFVLDFEGKEMPFLPGQWIDLFIDTGGEPLIGGFSITSSPVHVDRIQLTVRKPHHPCAALYLHEQAKVGDTVLIAGPSGDFYYKPEMGKSLVLIAGGIGITPLISMVKFVDEANLDVKVSLLYSAGAPADFVFFDELQAISARNPRINCLFTVTDSIGEEWKGRVGRIDAILLAEYAQDKSALFYICGPGGMAEAMMAILDGFGVPASQVMAEGW